MADFPRYIPRPARFTPPPDVLCGENHYAAKMTRQDVEELRADRARGMTIDDIFLKYRARCGISYANVRKILAGMSWK